MKINRVKNIFFLFFFAGSRS